MSASTSKRLFAIVIGCLVFVSYLGMRDTIKVTGDIPKKDVKAVVAGLEEWSSPKLFRHIEISPWRNGDGVLLGEVRESNHRWSVTAFTNQAGIWQKFAFFLVEEDKKSVDEMIRRYR